MLYDFAYTAFSVVVLTFVFGLYFKRIIVQGPEGDLLWGLAGASSTILLAAIAPWLGAMADEAGAKKRTLTFCALTAMTCGAALSLTGPGMVPEAMALFIVGNAAFQMNLILYHAFLPELAEPRETSRISGYGWALGYAGAATTLILVWPLIAGGISPETQPRVRLAFLVQGAFFFLFALPAFFCLRERPPYRPKGGPILAAAFTRVRETVSHVSSFRQATRFLIAYFLYAGGSSTVLYFAVIYAADTLALGMRDLVIVYLTVMGMGMVGAVLFGNLGDRIGIKNTLYITLVLWLGVLCGAYVATGFSTFLAVAASGGLVVGSTESLSRAMMALLAPEDRTAEFFSFYGLAGKFSVAAGPLVFGLVSYLTGSQRLAILSIAVFFISGLACLRRVSVEEGQSEKETFSP